MANVASNTQLNAEHLAADAAKAARVAQHAAFFAARAKLLAGSYTVGADNYSGDFWVTSKRPTAEITLDTDWRDSVEWRTLHKLPNGDWMEVLGGKSWTRHTYDKEYALDRARRANIGGYAFRADLATVIEQIVASGANRTVHYAEWQMFVATKPYQRAYGHAGNLYAAEQQQRWIKCITEDMLPRHPQHAALLQRAIALLSETDAIREFPAEIDTSLFSVINELEAALAVEAK
jgi:hypothetical protein